MDMHCWMELYFLDMIQIFNYRLLQLASRISLALVGYVSNSR